MRKRVVPAAAFLILAGALSLAGPVPPSAGSKPQAALAPFSEAYLRFLGGLRTGSLPAAMLGGPIPSPLDLRHFNMDLPFKAEALPLAYDLRTTDKMTSVKNEGARGGSYAFAALASLESFLRPLETWNFSENHLFTAAGSAGFLEAVVGLMARWSDPIRENDDPWPASVQASGGPAKHVQNVIFLPPRTAPLDNDRIKQAILDKGAVYAEMVFAGTFYNPGTFAYFGAEAPGESRAVAIAGWDDNFDRGKFIAPPPGNGAFLCKNSLGASWGSAGYFYVSYYDPHFARDHFSAAFTAEPAAGLKVSYQYDPNGCTARLGFGSESAWFANVFAASSADPLVSVGFYTFTQAGDYDVIVYKDPAPGAPRSGTAAVRVTGSFDAPGYHTVPLSASIPLVLNQRFSVVVKLKTPGDAFPVPLEHPVAVIAAPFTANPGESFISADGAEWNDLNTYAGALYASTNVCLKAFAGGAPLYPPINPRVERLVNNLYFFKEYVDKVSWQINPNNTLPIARYRVYRKVPGVAGSDFQRLGETSSLLNFFYVRAVKKDDPFVYRVTAIMADGRESDPAEISI